MSQQNFILPSTDNNLLMGLLFKCNNKKIAEPLIDSAIRTGLITFKPVFQVFAPGKSYWGLLIHPCLLHKFSATSYRGILKQFR